MKSASPVSPIRSVLLTNFLPPYRVPVLRQLTSRFERFQIFLSTRMESDRHWSPVWTGLDVSVQKNVTLKRKWSHPHGFSEDNYVHIPYDTYARLRKNGPDVVISSELGLRTVQAALYRRSNPASRLVIWATLSEYTEQGRGKIREWIRRRVIPSADAIIVNGESGARYIKRFGFPDDKIFRVPQTTDTSEHLRLPITIRARPRTFLYVGRLVELKGVRAFIDAMITAASSNPGENYRVRFAGDGPLRDSFTKLSIPRNLSLEFLGNLEYEALPAEYGRADILVLPTLSDEWGLVVIEAMAAGLPVLGSIYSQAVEELCREGVNGWCFTPGTPGSLGSALDRALSVSDEVLLRMRHAARNTVSSMDAKSMADGIFRAVMSTLTDGPKK